MLVGYRTLNLITVFLAILGCWSVALAAPTSMIAKHGNASTSVPFWVEENTQDELKRATELLSAGQLDQAILILRNITREEPNNPDAQLLLGTALALVPQRTQAIEALQKAIELRPSFAPAYVVLGTTLARFVELEAAERMFEKALALDPQIVDAHVSLGLLLAQRKQLVSARGHFQQAIKLAGNTPAAGYAHYLLAQVLAGERNFEQALIEIENAIRLLPDFSDAYLSQGLIKKRLRDEPGALLAFKKTVELSPGSAKGRYELGAAYLLAGQILPAIEHLQKSLELRPGDRFAMYHLCRAFRRAGRNDDSKVCQQQLSAIIEGQLKASDLTIEELNNEGVKLEQDGQLAAALEKYRDAVNLDPLQTVFRRNLALVLCRLGRWEEAVEELKEVLEIDPADAEATKALYIALDKVSSVKTKTPDGKTKPEKR